MEIPKLPWQSPEAISMVRGGVPVVLTGCPLSNAVSNDWTFDYLKEIMTPDAKLDVYTSSTPRFQYWDTKKNVNQYAFDPPTDKEMTSFTEFLDKSNEATNAPGGQTKWYYLQASMTDAMGHRMLKEYTKFPLDVALQFKSIGKWDELTTNLLLCGRPGVITPLHFDEQQNLFAQLHGRKRVRLFSPNDWEKLYTFPLGHPCDRQTRVVLPEQPGSIELELPAHRDSFPLFGALPSTEMYVDMDAGDILYIPQYWFHQMESITDNISMSWWYKHNIKDVDPTNIDHSKISFVAVRRNLERLISTMVGNGKGAHEFFLAVAAGLLTLPSADGNGIPCLNLRSVMETDIAEATSQNLTVKPHWPAVLTQAVQMATLVLPPGEAPSFIQQIAAGRYSGLDSCY